MLTPEPVRRRNPLVPVLIAVALVTAGLATWAVVDWQQSRDDRTSAAAALVAAREELRRAESDESVGRVKARDEATKNGEAAIVTLNTLDYRKVDENLDAWEKVTTGDLHDQIAGGRASTKQNLEAAKTATTADALALSLVDLDDRAGRATMIAAMKVTVNVDGKEPQLKYLRLRATLQRADGWKLSGIESVA